MNINELTQLIEDHKKGSDELKERAYEVAMWAVKMDELHHRERCKLMVDNADLRLQLDAWKRQYGNHMAAHSLEVAK